MNKKAGEMILCECYENYCQGFNMCIKKEKGEINLLVYTGKWQVPVGIKPKFRHKAGY